jgi:NADH-quinone oxidoreductase subunit N
MGLILAVIEKSQPFIPTWAAQPGYQLKPFAAELILVVTIVATLLAPFFTRRSNITAALVSLLGLLAALVALLAMLFFPPENGFQLRGMLVSDQAAILWKLMLVMFTIGVILMWFSTVAGQMHEGDGPEFFTLLLGATLGMCFMSSTSNLLMLFMAVEMASLPSYVLAGFRKTDRIGSEASLKYVLFGAATSAIMVYGLSMLYGLYGTLQVEELAAQLGDFGRGGVPLILGLAGIIIGIGFKISAVPFHFWCPDVFEGAGVDVSVFLSVASKGAGLMLLMRILMSIAEGVGHQGSVLVGLAVVVGIIGSVTATVGNTGALVQTNIKRLLAYSSIAHAGYMLCALSLLVAWRMNGDQLSNTATQSILLYLAVYLFMNLGAFTVAGLIYRQTGSEDIRDYAAMGRRNPVMAACMAVFMFSLVGMPPFAGFIAKFNVMWALGSNGGWWWALVAVIGVNTIFSLYYYVRVLRMMYLTDNEQPGLSVNPLGTAISVVCALMLVAMLVGYNPLWRLTSRFGRLHLRDATAPAAVVEADQGTANAAAIADKGN